MLTHLPVFRRNLTLTKAQHTWLERKQLFKLSRALLYLAILVPRLLWYTVETLCTAHWSPNTAPRALYSMIKVLFLATKAYHSENEIPQPATQVYGSTVEILQSATQATHHWATGASKSTRYSTNRKLFSPSWLQCLSFIVFCLPPPVISATFWHSAEAQPQNFSTKAVDYSKCKSLIM